MPALLRFVHGVGDGSVMSGHSLVADLGNHRLPGRAITMVVPMTPGTGPDLLARTSAEELAG